MLSRRALLFAPLSLAASGCASLLVPKPEPWPRWAAHDAGAMTRLDHSAWGAFVRRHAAADTSGVTRVAYRRVGPDDRSALRAYVARQSAVAVSRLHRDEQYDYWVNLYNAATVDLVLTHYPVKSILDIGISPGLLEPGPWGAPLLKVEGETLSLGDIEHRILRPLWRDARSHYALNCASVGCPNLRAGPWTPAALDTAARDYVNHPRGVRLADGRLTVSSIFAWYEPDFGGSEGAVLRHLRGLARQDLAQALSGRDGYDAHAYDWTLNDAA